MNPEVVCTLVTLLICQTLCQSSGDTKDGVVYAENNGHDGYYFKYATRDESREERGQFVNGIWTVTGKASWTSPDGELQEFSYIADDQGYRVLKGLAGTVPPHRPPTGPAQGPFSTPAPPQFPTTFAPVVPIIGSGALASLAG